MNRELTKLIAKCERTMDGDSNDAEHDALFELIQYLKETQGEHTQDSDCCESIDIQTDTCTVCHVYHGDPCLDCGAQAYHKPTCPRLSP